MNVGENVADFSSGILTRAYIIRLFVSVITGTHQRAGFDVAETQA